MPENHSQEDPFGVPAHGAATHGERSGAAARAPGAAALASASAPAGTVEHPRAPAASRGEGELSAAPPAGAVPRRPAGPAGLVLGNLDVVLIVVGLAPALALGAPSLGVLVGAGGWLLQRALAVLDRRLIDRAAAPGSQLGLNFVDAFARIWLLAGAIIVAGAVGHRADGLAAAVLILLAYSLAFALR